MISGNFVANSCVLLKATFDFDYFAETFIKINATKNRSTRKCIYCFTFTELKLRLHFHVAPTIGLSCTMARERSLTWNDDGKFIQRLIVFDVISMFFLFLSSSLHKNMARRKKTITYYFCLHNDWAQILWDLSLFPPCFEFAC